MIKSLVFSAFTLLMLSSCHSFFGEKVKGNGNVVTENRSIGNFSGVDVSGAIDVYIKQDNANSVRIETDENIQGLIITRIEGNVLHIKPENNTDLNPTRLKVYVSAPSFTSLEASGACKIYSENKITSSEPLDIDLTGASNAIVAVNAPKITADLSGAGLIELSGETKQLSIDGSGSSDIKCFDLKAEDVEIDISGAGNAEVFASARLDVEVSGAGDVKYRGSPSVNQRISGAGSVKKVD